MTQPYEGQPPMTAPAHPQKKAGLLDIHFTKFLSLSLISVWWVVALVLILIAAIVGVIAGVSTMGSTNADGATNSLNGVLLIIGSLIGAPIAAILTRLFLESVAVLFRIASNTSDIAARRF
jgi:hypothetical protein